MNKIIEWLPLVIGVICGYLILRQMTKLADKSEKDSIQEQSHKILMLHKNPKLFVPLIVLFLCLLALSYLKGLPIQETTVASGKMNSLFKEFNEKDPGSKASLIACLAMILFSLAGHWRIPKYWQACLSAATVTAITLTFLELYSGIYTQPVSHLGVFALIFFMTIFISSLIGFLSFFRKRRQKYKNESSNLGVSSHE